MSCTRTTSERLYYQFPSSYLLILGLIIEKGILTAMSTDGSLSSRSCLLLNQEGVFDSFSANAN
ncbi:MAG: hypothetical protein CMJ81_00155 [Planctomycetaceae bacterium]|nr:hypothetical protein [Planctomycetaceae bacterium]